MNVATLTETAISVLDEISDTVRSEVRDMAFAVAESKKMSKVDAEAVMLAYRMWVVKKASGEQ